VLDKVGPLEDEMKSLTDSIDGSKAKLQALEGELDHLDKQAPHSHRRPPESAAAWETTTLV
jgi:hypothetical protein